MNIFKALYLGYKTIRDNKDFDNQMEVTCKEHGMAHGPTGHAIGTVLSLKVVTGIDTKLIFDGDTPVVIVKATRNELAYSKPGTLYRIQSKVDRAALIAEKHGIVVRLANDDAEKA